MAASGFRPLSGYARAMPKLAANLSMLFVEVDFLERFAAAARAGFRAVEYQYPYDWKPADDRRAPRATRASTCCCTTCRRATRRAASAAPPA